MKKPISNIVFSKNFLVLAIFFAGIAGYAYFAFMPLYLDNIGFSDADILVIMLFMGLGIALSSSYFGKLSDRIGKRKIFFVFGISIQILVFFLIPLNNHITYFCILNLIRGLALGMRMPPTNALFADLVELSNSKDESKGDTSGSEISGTQLSFLSATKSTGWAIGVLLSGWIVDVFGIESLILFLVIMTGISLMFSLPVKDIQLKDHIQIKNEEIEEDENLEMGENSSPKIEMDGKKSVKPKVKTLLFVSIFFRHFALIPIMQIISIILTDAMVPDDLIGIIIAINPISQIIAMIVVGRIIDNPKITEKIILAIGYGLSSIVLMAYFGGVVTEMIGFFVVAQICLGVAWGFIFTGANKYIVNRAHKDRAQYLGKFTFTLQFSKILAYIGFGFFLWRIEGIIPQMFLPYLAIIPLIGIILVYWL